MNIYETRTRNWGTMTLRYSANKTIDQILHMSDILTWRDPCIIQFIFRDCACECIVSK